MVHLMFYAAPRASTRFQHVIYIFRKTYDKKMMVNNSSMKISRSLTSVLGIYLVLLILCCFSVNNNSLYARAQGDSADAAAEEEPKKVSKEQEMCNGIFLTYDFSSKEKLYPHLKNASAQPWSFMSTASIVNMGLYELKAWKMFIGFQHGESIVSVDGASLVDVDGPPYKVGKNGTTIVGNPNMDLKTAVDTAGDYEQMQAFGESPCDQKRKQGP